MTGFTFGASLLIEEATGFGFDAAPTGFGFGAAPSTEEAARSRLCK